MSAWDLTCRPPPTATDSLSTQAQAGQRNDRLAKLRVQPYHQLNAVPYVPAAGAAAAAAVTPSVPLLWADLAATGPLTTAANGLQALLTTATLSNPGYCTSLTQMAWLQALHKQELARQCSVDVAALVAAGGANKFSQPSSQMQIPQQVQPVARTMLLNSQHNSGQCSASSSPDSQCATSPAVSLDLSGLAGGLALPLGEHASKPNNRSSSSSLSMRSSSLSSCSNSSTSSSSRANSFDGDYTASEAASRRGSSMSGRTPTDRRARKKDQNRRAAYNYRRKKMEERDRMIEEEARLVHRHVRLAGKIARLEERILTMLDAETRKVTDANGFSISHLCPVCSKACVDIPTLREHLKTQHQAQQQCESNDSLDPSSSEVSSWMPKCRESVGMTSEEKSGDGESDECDDDSDPMVEAALGRDTSAKHTVIGSDNQCDNNKGENNSLLQFMR